MLTLYAIFLNCIDFEVYWMCEWKSGSLLSQSPFIPMCIINKENEELSLLNTMNSFHLVQSTQTDVPDLAWNA